MKGRIERLRSITVVHALTGRIHRGQQNDKDEYPSRQESIYLDSLTVQPKKQLATATGEPFAPLQKSSLGYLTSGRDLQRHNRQEWGLDKLHPSANGLVVEKRR